MAIDTAVMESTEGMTKMHYFHRLLGALCEVQRDPRCMHKYLVGRLVDNGFRIRPFDSREQAELYRDTLPEIQRQSGLQPWYVDDRHLML